MDKITDAKTKYYLIFNYTDDGEYTGHDYWAVPEGKKLSDYLDKNDRVTEVTKAEYDEQQGFYKQEVK